MMFVYICENFYNTFGEPVAYKIIALEILILLETTDDSVKVAIMFKKKKQYEAEYREACFSCIKLKE